jgi:hypothetical protein
MARRRTKPAGGSERGGRNGGSETETGGRRSSSRVTPDPIDFRDRAYQPPVRARPPDVCRPRAAIPVLDQAETSACTGFALAAVVHALLRSGSSRGSRVEPVSPFMLYSMARRYDEFPGSAEDGGSSLRGALKGWYKHGICRRSLWPALAMPEVPDDPRVDWWSEAMRRPLGAYYRVDCEAIADMHVALADVGVLYASARCHAGWEEGYAASARRTRDWVIPQRAVAPSDLGHAFAIVGYTAAGFLVQSSWGTGWGNRGRAILAYADWRENAMDCWVAQLGVVTSVHLAIAQAAGLRVERGRVEIAADGRLRDHELAPYVIDMENNGRLSSSGRFRTRPEDVQALVTTYLGRARREWGLRARDPVDLAIYAHGGLTSEDSAADKAARWTGALYHRRIFPIFLMWETGLLKTLSNIVEEAFRGQPVRTAGLQRWWDTRLERWLAGPGTKLWGEMKENAAAISGPRGGGTAEAGGALLLEHLASSPEFDAARDRLHLIAHSAGSIVHFELADAWIRRGLSFRSLNMLAPAATVALFRERLLPHLESKAVGRYHQWHLSDAVESADSSTRALLGYGRSLLYLVSESFEGGTRTPIVGLQKYYDALPAHPAMRAWAAPGPESASAAHAGFGDDEVTMNSLIARIEGMRA